MKITCPRHVVLYRLLACNSLRIPWVYKLITDYTIISIIGTTSNKASSIESEAKRLIKDGWTPLGSITSDNEGALYQVMIKYTQSDNTHPTAKDIQTCKSQYTAVET